MVSRLGDDRLSRCSEVWHAFDLEDAKYVACKIHHVNKDWKEDKKANYVKLVFVRFLVDLSQPKLANMQMILVADMHCERRTFTKR